MYMMNKYLFFGIVFSISGCSETVLIPKLYELPNTISHSKVLPLPDGKSLLTVVDYKDSQEMFVVQSEIGSDCREPRQLLSNVPTELYVGNHWYIWNKDCRSFTEIWWDYNNNFQPNNGFIFHFLPQFK